MLKRLLFLLLFIAGSIFPTGTSAQINLPYTEDFEGGNGGWTATSIDTLTNWEYGTPTFFPTNNAHSGSFCWDINLDTSYNNEAEATLLSPVFNAGPGNLKRISFWHYTFTESSWDGFRMEISVNGQAWQTLGTVYDPFATNWYTDSSLNSSLQPAWEGFFNGWIKSTYLLQNIVNQTVQFRFIFTSDFSVFDAGVSIDDFSFVTLPDIDFEVNSIHPIAAVFNGTATDSIQVSIKNNGTSTAAGFIIECNQNGTFATSTTFADSIQSNQIRSFRIPAVTAATGNNTVCIKVILPGDGDSLNDELCTQYRGIAGFSLPYTDNFNTTITDWYQESIGDTATRWEYGSPQFGATASSFSPPTCWDINLQTAYSGNAKSILYSPVFDLTGSSLPYLGFYMNYNTEGSWDGIRIEYSLNLDTAWHVLGINNDPAGINWYTNSLLNSTQLPGWSGNSQGFIYCRYNLSGVSTSGYIQFRFVFESDVSVSRDGVSIDNFIISSSAPKDASVLRVVSPIGTNYIAGSTLIVELANTGTQLLNTFPVTYQINQQPPVTVQWNGSLQPGSSTLFTMGNILLNSGVNNLQVYINWNQDTVPGNDTAKAVIYLIPSIALPYFNNFNSGFDGWTSNTLLPGNVWQLGTPAYGSTNSAFSPPACWDINLNTPYSSSNTANLYSPPFNVQGLSTIEIKFRLNFYTQANFDGLTLYYSTDNITWQVLGTLNDANGKNWYNSLLNNGSGPAWTGSSGGWEEVYLKTQQFINEDVIFLRFSFNADGIINYDGVSIDDFFLHEAYPNDAHVEAVIQPLGIINASSPDSVIIRLKNEGTAPLTTLTLNYSVDNGTPVTQIWNGNLITGASTLFSFSPQIFNSGIHVITAYSSWTADSVPENDTARTTVEVVQPIALPYFENFDAGASNWSVQTTGVNTTQWELGLPGYGTTNSAYSFPNCWDVNLYNPYNNLARTYLRTPVFNFSNATGVSLRFWLNYSTEINTDGLFIEYTTDESTWLPLSSLNDPLGTNWYNSNLFNGKAGWTGNSQGWQQVNLNSFQLGGLPYCRLRFGFQSDFSVNGDGVSLDDFSLTTFTGISEHQISDFLIYPNPANDILHLDNLIPGIKTIHILDATGREVIRQTATGAKSSLDIRELLPGTYFILLESGTAGKSVSHFIKAGQ